jgi:hypothetical protein
MHTVSEDQCAVCKHWPEAERPERRRQHLESDDYVRCDELIPTPSA